MEKAPCFFEWQDFTHGAYCGENFILLKVLENKYVSIDPKASQILDFLLNNSFLKLASGNYLLEEGGEARAIGNYINLFLKENIIQETNKRLRNNKFALSVEAGGIHVQEWSVGNNSSLKVGKLLILEAVFLLYFVHFTLKKYKLKGILSMIREASSKKNLVYPTIKESKVLSKAIEIASLFFPKKTMCLPFSAALALLHFKKGYKCDFIIGVQNVPFHAHAWIRVNGVVVNDRSELENKLAPIVIVSS